MTLTTSVTAIIYKLELQPENIYEQGQVLLINKPLHWTSFDAVKKIRNLARVKKVGHAGTLDPLATGLLIICTGKCTRRINEFMASEKEYTGTFTLGATTPSYDLETEPGNFKTIESIRPELIHQATALFSGNITQIPPAFSAIKKAGKRAYEMARQGLEVKMEPRNILISEFQITEIHLPIVGFRVVCSTGTYIRSLAMDFGERLGCGAYLSSLCRTRIGIHTLEQSMTMEEVEREISRNLSS
jgi:tRNA pseudouridine55 synthase